MPLTDTAIRNAKPGEKPAKLFDGGGQNPNGSRWWRFNYRLAGKRRTLSMGGRGNVRSGTAYRCPRGGQIMSASLNRGLISWGLSYQRSWSALR